jgi:predicted nuclease of predicted toxin-antitoxin system
MRILIDMNLTPLWAPYLANADYDAMHWSVAGSPLAKDREICDFARQHGYVLVTNDLDFPQILAHTREAAPSVICQTEIKQGAIVVLDWSDRPRARVLPLRWHGGDGWQTDGQI